MTCPNCSGELGSQYDTHSKENFWHCWECDQSYAIDGVTATIHMTSVPTYDPYEAALACQGSIRKWCQENRIRFRANGFHWIFRLGNRITVSWWPSSRKIHSNRWEGRSRLADDWPEARYVIEQEMAEGKPT